MIGKLFTMAVLTGGATLALGVLPASAHYPEVTATNACVDGHPAIEVRATAWQTDLPNDHRMNRNVRVDISGPHTSDGVTGLFVAPDFWSQAEFAVPDAVGDTLTARATAIDAWGPNGEYGYAGTYRETTIDVVDVCHTDVAPAPTTMAPPVTSVPGPVQDRVHTEVLGQVLVRSTPAALPEVAAAEVAPAPQDLALTGGSHTSDEIAVSVALLGAGITLVGIGRRRTLAR
jgi:hypothetical protein